MDGGRRRVAGALWRGLLAAVIALCLWNSLWGMFLVIMLLSESYFAGAVTAFLALLYFSAITAVGLADGLAAQWPGRSFRPNSSEAKR